ncbi:MAG: hypothetical protein J7L91_02705 [Candidatus Korarchaeota archaeon]|nr:hypothetical protein [Candidatus Korarchaeota archaeon]
MREIFEAPRQKGTWDRGIEYGLLRKRLMRLYRRMREKAGKSRRYRKRLVHTLVLMIQLRNGCRVSEAVEALQKMVSTGQRKVMVRVRKTKKEEKEREVVLPKSVPDSDLRLIREDTKTLTVDQVKSFCKYNLGINTHTLRYAFITHLAVEKGIQPNVVAKITGHVDLDHLITYTQRVKAEEILEKEIDW